MRPCRIASETEKHRLMKTTQGVNISQQLKICETERDLTQLVAPDPPLTQAAVGPHIVRVSGQIVNQWSQLRRELDLVHRHTIAG